MTDYPHRADLYRRSETATLTDRGEKTWPWVRIRTGWPCNYQMPAPGRVERTPAGAKAVAQRKLYLAPGSGARVEDRVLVTGSGGTARMRLVDLYPLGDEGWDDEADAELSTETFVESADQEEP
jgi:hypothetical protein